MAISVEQRSKFAHNSPVMVMSSYELKILEVEALPQTFKLKIRCYVSYHNER